MARQSDLGSAVGLRDIAGRLNVAVCTVSRALNGDTGVGVVRAASIRALAEQMGYRPQPMRRRRTRAVGLVISTSLHRDMQDPNDRYFQQISWWMERLVTRHRMHLHLQFVNRDAPIPEVPPIISENRVDGIILAGHPSVEFCKLCQSLSVPAVVISDTMERTGLESVMIDETDAIRELVQRLTTMGHREIAWISTERRYPVIAAAEDAFLNTASRAGLNVRPEHVIHNLSPNLAGGRRAAEALLGSSSLPTAFVFANDWMALGGLGHLQRRGIEVPKQISVIGRGNDTICDEADPRITTIDRRIEEILSLALDALVELIGHSREPVQHRIPARIVWRDSCTSPGRQ